MTSAQTHATNVETIPCDWLLYEEMTRTGNFCHVKMVTLVNPLTVALFCGPARLSVDVIYEAECKFSRNYVIILIKLKLLFNRQLYQRVSQTPKLMKIMMEQFSSSMIGWYLNSTLRLPDSFYI